MASRHRNLNPTGMSSTTPAADPAREGEYQGTSKGPSRTKSSRLTVASLKRSASKAMESKEVQSGTKFFSAYAKAWIGMSPIWLMGEAVTGRVSFFLVCLLCELIIRFGLESWRTVQEGYERDGCCCWGTQRNPFWLCVCHFDRGYINFGVNELYCSKDVIVIVDETLRKHKEETTKTAEVLMAAGYVVTHHDISQINLQILFLKWGCHCSR